MKAKHFLAKTPRAFTMAMLVTVLAFGLVSCDNGTTSGLNVPGNYLDEKIYWLRTNTRNGGNYVIEVNADESIPPNQRFEYTGKNNITITLRGGGGNYTLNLSNNGNMFVVSNGVTLILDNITLKGRSFNTHPLIFVGTGGSLQMSNSVVITGNTATNNSGGAVWAAGTFTMNGGTISGNAATTNGGGVIVSGGTFTMKSGNISGNNANNSGGGVAVLNKGTFIMSGGTISGNTARNGGGGVTVEYGNFTMSGGAISGNISESGGGGVYTANARNGAGSTQGIGNFIMNNGTISGNTATGSGGGVSANNEGTFILYNGSITGNTGLRGGGVAVAVSSTFTMSAGNISGNTAKDSGGGVFVWGAFTKTGGTITGYESDRRIGNVVSKNPGTAESEKGHTVYAYYSGSKITKRKEISADSKVNLSYVGRTGSFSGEWDF